MGSESVKIWQMWRLNGSDADAVTALVGTAFDNLEVRLDPPPTALSETVASIAEQILGGGGVAADLTGHLIGSILWGFYEGIYIKRLAVHPEWRRRGIACELLGYIDTEARRLGIRRVHLETRMALTGNLQLFGKCGFKEYARQPRDSDPQRTLVKFEKWLR